MVITTLQLCSLHGPSDGLSGGFCHEHRFKFSSQQRIDPEKSWWPWSSSYRNRRRQQNFKLRKTACPSKPEPGTSETWLLFPVLLPACGPTMSPPHPSVSSLKLKKPVQHNCRRELSVSEMLKPFFTTCMKSESSPPFSRGSSVYRQNICTFKCSSICHPQHNPY